MKINSFAFSEKELGNQNENNGKLNLERSLHTIKFSKDILRNNRCSILLLIMESFLSLIYPDR